MMSWPDEVAKRRWTYFLTRRRDFEKGGATSLSKDEDANVHEARNEGVCAVSPGFYVRRRARVYCER